METTTKQMTRVSKIEGLHITAGEKRCVLAVVNANKPEMFGKWLKANRFQLMVEPQANGTYKVTFNEKHNGILGEYYSANEVIVKLS